MRRAAALLVLAVLVVGSTATFAVGPAIGQEASAGGAAANNQSLGLEELVPGGTKPANAPPSIRQNGRYGEFAVEYLPTGLLVQEGENSASWQYLNPAQTVSRNKIKLRSKRPYGASTQDYVVEIAHYRVGQETLRTESGSTQTRRAATNVTTYSRTVSFSGGYDLSMIDLRPHYDGAKRTVMCVREPGEPSCLANPGDSRWTFYHDSSKATMSVPTNSAGARLSWALMMLLLPFFGATVITLYGGRKAVEHAKAGPQISAIWWVVVAVGGIMGIVLGWSWLSETLIRAPWLVSAAGGILLGVIAVEWFGRRTFGAGFLQFELAEGFDPTSPEEIEEALNETEDRDPDDGSNTADAPGILRANFHIARFARGDKGDRSAIRKGIRKFWARARGATADLETDGNMQTKIDVNGPIEELYLLDPEEDEPIDYRPEGHRLEFPDLVTYDEDDEGNVHRQIHPVPYIAGLGTLGISWVAGNLLAGSGMLGLFVGALGLFAFKIAQPTDGHLRADLAPTHYHHAVATMLTHARGLADAKSWDDWFRNYAESEAENHAERQELLDDRSESQMERLFDRYVGGGDGEPPVRDKGASSDD